MECKHKRLVETDSVQVKSKGKGQHMRCVQLYRCLACLQVYFGISLKGRKLVRDYD